MKKIVVTVVLFLLSTAIYAEGWYAGLAYSILDAEIEDAGGSELDSEPEGINVFVGHGFNKHFAVEGLLGTGIGDDSIEDSSIDFELKSVFGVSAVGILPLSEAFNIYGKLGIAQVEYDDSDGDSSDASGVMYGVGAAVNVTKKFGLNLEYVQYPEGEYDDFDNDVEASALNIGGYFKF